ncbi:MAG: SDR family oxidoreductase [Bacteroidota bacterium]
MELGITNKVALVAAASQGLGKAAALSLAREGVQLAICSRNEKSISETAEEIRRETGVKVYPVKADVSRPAEIEMLVGSVMNEFGRIDILVNNAGGPPTGKITALPDAEWEKGFNLTMMSMIRLTRAVLPVMEKQQWGRVITIVSITAKQPIDDLLISSTLRPGILGISKVLANQYGRFNITVNTVCPGHILTQRQAELSQSRSKEKNISMDQYLKESALQIPTGRLGNPEELGDVIAFLASERASYINGANILVDGGQAKGIH